MCIAFDLSDQGRRIPQKFISPHALYLEELINHSNTIISDVAIHNFLLLF